MDKINELLEKYFRGETTLNEEKELKNYFSSNCVSPEHKRYSPLFEAFKQEAEVKMPLQKRIPLHTSSKRLWLQISTFSGIAATLLICFWLLQPQQTNNSLALMNPPRNEDNDYARKYVKEKIDKVNDILNTSMKPIKSLDKVRNGIRPINKINETRDKLQDIQNKIQLK